MYINTISFNGKKVSMFLTSEECFTPYNPVYKAVQICLKEMGYVPECNHVFKGGMGNIHFTHSETDVFCPDTNYYLLDAFIRTNKNELHVAYGFITDLEYIFLTGVPAEKVANILK